MDVGLVLFLECKGCREPFSCDRLLYGLDFALRPSSTSRLIASGRDGLSPCAAAHPSMRDKGPGNNLTPIKVPFPVVRGRPRFFVLSLIDFGTIWVNTKLSGRPGAGTTQTALTQAKG